MDVLEAQIAIFEKRSSALRFGAYVILIMIFILVGVGGWVFRIAEQITTSDLNGNIEKRMSDNLTEIDRLKRENQEITELYKSYIPEVKKQIASFFDDFPKLDPYSGNVNNPTVEIRLDVSLPELTSAFIADKLEEGLTRYDLENLKVNIMYSGEIGVIDLQKSEWRKVIKNIRLHTLDFPSGQLKANLKREADNKERISFLYNVNEVMRQHLVQVAAGVEIASDALARNGTDGLYRLLQTNITRFGTLAVITFLIMILIPLYRYNIRLSAFYLAKADSLRMTSHFDKMTFERLSKVFTPGLEFGKMPPTPISQIVELIRPSENQPKD